MTLYDFLPVLDLFAGQHTAMTQLWQLLQSPVVLEHASKEKRPFPVKISLPVYFGFRLVVSFPVLKAESAPDPSVMEPPPGYAQLSRTQAHKLSQSAHKRLLLTNLTL